MAHKLKIGQIVDLAPHILRSMAQGPYEIRHLTPASDGDPEDPRYCIKSTVEDYERIAPESDLTLSANITI